MNDECQRNLKERTKAFALAMIRLFASLPRTEEARILGRQMLRSGTSVGAHYREACRARSKAEFVSKLEAGSQELEETIYWLELLRDAKIANAETVNLLASEANEIMAMQTASVRTTKQSMIHR